MKKHILLIALLAACCMPQAEAQNYVVTSLATPGAATFSSDRIQDGVVTLPFAAATDTLHIQTNQQPTATSDADWCEASFADGILSLTVTENTGEEARTAIITLRSKDFHPLLITVKQEARLVFGVISDTHVGNTCGAGYKVKIPQALQHLTGYGKLDAMAVVGDLTDGGKPAQYTEFVQFFGSEENILNPVDNFLFMMGNHDNYPSDGQGQTNYKTGLKKFNRNRNYPLDQYVLIKGYPFITISQRAGANNDDNASNGTASYPNTVVTTLKRYLKQAAEDAPGKPIFVFTHVAPRNTCYSTWGDLEGAAWAMWRLNETLNQYPQAVVFCGHSHYPLGDPRSIHQGANPNSANKNYYTVINTASTTYSEINPGAVEAGIHPEGYTYVTEGMILVEQPNGDIEIRRYDTYRNVEIDPEHRWVLKAPFDGSQFQYADVRDKDDNPNNVPLRTGLPAPEFINPSETSISAEVYPGDAKITWNQAVDNECVFRYKVSLYKGEQLVKSAFVFSQFYLTIDTPEQISYTFDDLQPGTEYKAEVYAYDSYDNVSETSLSTVFTTPTDDAPMPEPIGWWTFDNPDDLLESTGIATLQAAVHSAGSAEPVEGPSFAQIIPVEGPSMSNRAASVPVGSSLLMNTNLNTNKLSTYTWLMDIHLPQISGYTSLFQNDLTNTKDASLFVYNGTIGKGAADLGYHGMITSTGWHRIVFAVRDNKAKLYIDGTLVSQSASASDVNWQLTTGALFFADQDGEEHTIEIADLRFWDKMLTSGQVAELGKAETSEPVEVTIPDALGVWTFDDPTDLLSGTGTATLMSAEHATDGTGGVRVFADPMSQSWITQGPTEGNGAVRIPFGSSLYMNANLGTDEIGTYSILWDVKGEDLSTYVPLLQNDLENKKDGSLFFNKNKVGLGGSLGYNGQVNNNQWYRIVFVVEAPNKATLYVDGTMVSSCEHDNAYNLHWKLTTGALFFADNDGEEKDIETAEIRFWNEALTPAQADKLGAAGSDFVPTPPEPIDPDAIPDALCSWTFDNTSDPLVATGGTGSAMLHAYGYSEAGDSWMIMTQQDAHISSLPASEMGLEDGILYVPVGSGLLMAPSVEGPLTTYSFLMDFKLEDVSGFASLFQNHITNKEDASLFVKDGQIGLNDAGMGYSGTLQANTWHRLVVVVKDNYCTVYVDGQKVVKSISPSEQHWQMQSGLVFFADQDGEEKPIYISNLSFWTEELTDKNAFKLGKAGDAEAQPETLPEAIGTWTFDDPDNRFSGTGETTLTGWQKVDGVVSTGYFEEIPAIYGYKDDDLCLVVPVGYGLLLTRPDDGDLESYTWSMDVRLDDVSGYAALFQNDDTNAKDGSLFVKNGQVGVAGSAGTGYNGSIQAGDWHRITFVVNKLFGFVYIDGVKVGRSVKANDVHWKLAKNLLFFIDNDGEEKEVRVSELRFWDKPLTEGQIQVLGTMTAE